MELVLNSTYVDIKEQSVKLSNFWPGKTNLFKAQENDALVIAEYIPSHFDYFRYDKSCFISRVSTQLPTRLIHQLTEQYGGDLDTALHIPLPPQLPGLPQSDFIYHRIIYPDEVRIFCFNGKILVSAHRLAVVDTNPYPLLEMPVAPLLLNNIYNSGALCLGDISEAITQPEEERVALFDDDLNNAIYNTDLTDLLSFRYVPPEWRKYYTWAPNPLQGVLPVSTLGNVIERALNAAQRNDTQANFFYNNHDEENEENAENEEREEEGDEEE